MSSKPSKTSFEKTTSKLDSLISSLEEKTGMTRELLKAEQEKSSSAQGAIKSNVPVSKAPQPKVEETKVEQKKDEKKQVEKKEEQKTEKKDKKKDQKEQDTEQKAEKKEKKEKKTSAKPAEPTADQITAEDFARLDIRVGKITECWKHPESDYLYCEKIDIGEEVRSIGSGLQNCVPISEMTSDLVLILANLKERKLGGYPSHGMVLCAGDPNGHYFELLRPHPNSKLGERVTIDGLEKIAQEKGVLIDPKKNKALETVLPKCKVDENGVATFLNLKFKTSAGEVKAKSLKNMPIS